MQKQGISLMSTSNGLPGPSTSVSRASPSPLSITPNSSNTAGIVSKIQGQQSQKFQQPQGALINKDSNMQSTIKQQPLRQQQLSSSPSPNLLSLGITKNNLPPQIAHMKINNVSNVNVPPRLTTLSPPFNRIQGNNQQTIIKNTIMSQLPIQQVGIGSISLRVNSLPSLIPGIIKKERQRSVTNVISTINNHTNKNNSLNNSSTNLHISPFSNQPSQRGLIVVPNTVQNHILPLPNAITTVNAVPNQNRNQNSIIKAIASSNNTKTLETKPNPPASTQIDKNLLSPEAQKLYEIIQSKKANKAAQATADKTNVNVQAKEQGQQLTKTIQTVSQYLQPQVMQQSTIQGQQVFQQQQQFKVLNEHFQQIYPQQLTQRFPQQQKILYQQSQQQSTQILKTSIPVIPPAYPKQIISPSSGLIPTKPTTVLITSPNIRGRTQQPISSIQRNAPAIISPLPLRRLNYLSQSSYSLTPALRGNISAEYEKIRSSSLSDIQIKNNNSFIRVSSPLKKAELSMVIEIDRSDGKLTNSNVRKLAVYGSPVCTRSPGVFEGSQVMIQNSPAVRQTSYFKRGGLMTLEQVLLETGQIMARSRTEEDKRSSSNNSSQVKMGDDLNTPKKQFEYGMKSGILKNSTVLGSSQNKSQIVSPLKADSNQNSAIYIQESRNNSNNNKIEHHKYEKAEQKNQKNDRITENQAGIKNNKDDSKKSRESSKETQLELKPRENRNEKENQLGREEKYLKRIEKSNENIKQNSRQQSNEKKLLQDNEQGQQKKVKQSKKTQEAKQNEQQLHQQQLELQYQLNQQHEQDARLKQQIEEIEQQQNQLIQHKKHEIEEQTKRSKLQQEEETNIRAKLATERQQLANERKRIAEMNKQQEQEYLIREIEQLKLSEEAMKNSSLREEKDQQLLRETLTQQKQYETLAKQQQDLIAQEIESQKLREAEQKKDIDEQKQLINEFLLKQQNSSMQERKEFKEKYAAQQAEMKRIQEQQIKQQEEFERQLAETIKQHKQQLIALQKSSSNNNNNSGGQLQLVNNSNQNNLITSEQSLIDTDRLLQEKDRLLQEKEDMLKQQAEQKLTLERAKQEIKEREFQLLSQQHLALIQQQQLQLEQLKQQQIQQEKQAQQILEERNNIEVEYNNLKNIRSQQQNARGDSQFEVEQVEPQQQQQPQKKNQEVVKNQQKQQASTQEQQQQVQDNKVVQQQQQYQLKQEQLAQQKQQQSQQEKQSNEIVKQDQRIQLSKEQNQIQNDTNKKSQSIQAEQQQNQQSNINSQDIHNNEEEQDNSHEYEDQQEQEQQDNNNDNYEQQYQVPHSQDEQNQSEEGEGDEKNNIGDTNYINIYSSGGSNYQNQDNQLREEQNKAQQQKEYNDDGDYEETYSQEVEEIQRYQQKLGKDNLQSQQQQQFKQQDDQRIRESKQQNNNIQQQKANQLQQQQGNRNTTTQPSRPNLQAKFSQNKQLADQLSDLEAEIARLQQEEDNQTHYNRSNQHYVQSHHKNNNKNVIAEENEEEQYQNSKSKRPSSKNHSLNRQNYVIKSNNNNIKKNRQNAEQIAIPGQRLYDYAMDKLQRKKKLIQEILLQRQQAEIEKCTFNPLIVSSNRNLEDFHVRNERWQLNKKQHIEQISGIEKEKEIIGCTFSPAFYSPNKYSANYQAVYNEPTALYQRQMEWKNKVDTQLLMQKEANEIMFKEMSNEIHNSGTIYKSHYPGGSSYDGQQQMQYGNSSNGGYSARLNRILYPSSNRTHQQFEYYYSQEQQQQEGQQSDNVSNQHQNQDHLMGQQQQQDVHVDQQSNQIGIEDKQRLQKQEPNEQTFGQQNNKISSNNEGVFNGQEIAGQIAQIMRLSNYCDSNLELEAMLSGNHSHSNSRMNSQNRSPGQSQQQSQSQRKQLSSRQQSSQQKKQLKNNTASVEQSNAVYLEHKQEEAKKRQDDFARLSEDFQLNKPIEITRHPILAELKEYNGAIDDRNISIAKNRYVLTATTQKQQEQREQQNQMQVSQQQQQMQHEGEEEVDEQEEQHEERDDQQEDNNEEEEEYQEDNYDEEQDIRYIQQQQLQQQQQQQTQLPQKVITPHNVNNTNTNNQLLDYTAPTFGVLAQTNSDNEQLSQQLRQEHDDNEDIHP